jgi:hypothetical protein
MSATDSFTQNKISKNYKELMSNYINDALTNGSYGRVTE